MLIWHLYQLLAIRLIIALLRILALKLALVLPLQILHLDLYQLAYDLLDLSGVELIDFLELCQITGDPI